VGLSFRPFVIMQVPIAPNQKERPTGFGVSQMKSIPVAVLTRETVQYFFKFSASRK
jgi:hypothetical protein